jgi:hypothetical protein
MHMTLTALDPPGAGLSPEHVAKVTAVLTRPMTALEFADLFWPDRVKKVKQPGKRSRAGHALLNMLVRRGLVRRKKSSKGTVTFVLASINDIVVATPEVSCYWVLLLRGKNWGWLGPNDQMCETTQNPAQRSRYSRQADAMVMLWHFRKYSPERGKAMRLVRVLVRTP